LRGPVHRRGVGDPPREGSHAVEKVAEAPALAERLRDDRAAIDDVAGKGREVADIDAEGPAAAFSAGEGRDLDRAAVDDVADERRNVADIDAVGRALALHVDQAAVRDAAAERQAIADIDAG